MTTTRKTAKKPTQKIEPPDTTSVRTLITSVRPLAEHLQLHERTIYHWIDVNRIPGRHIVKVANYYDIDIPIHLGQSDKHRENSRGLNKPRQTLPICMRVYDQEMTIEEAAAELELSERAVQMILITWGTSLPLLTQTMLALEEKKISLDEAAAKLQVTKHNVHILRAKYGFRPEPKGKTPAKPEKPIVKRKKAAREAALNCIAGKLKLEEAAEAADLSLRTIHRAVGNLSPEIGLIQLAHWPKSFRKAYAEEIDRELPIFVPKLYDFAQNSRLLLKKWPKYPENVENWREATTKRMLIALLLGDETLETLAVKRRADAGVLSSLFDSDLQPLGLTYDFVINRPLSFQVALAELLIALIDRKRRVN